MSAHKYLHQVQVRLGQVNNISINFVVFMYQIRCALCHKVLFIPRGVIESSESNTVRLGPGSARARVLPNL